MKYNTGDALYNLTGWDWGGHGDMVYFTMGAYRDVKGQLITFKYVLFVSLTRCAHNCSVTISNRNEIGTFQNFLPNYEEQLRRPFFEFASTELSGTWTFRKPINDIQSTCLQEAHLGPPSLCRTL